VVNNLFLLGDSLLSPDIGIAQLLLNQFDSSSSKQLVWTPLLSAVNSFIQSPSHDSFSRLLLQNSSNSQYSSDAAAADARALWTAKRWNIVVHNPNLRSYSMLVVQSPGDLLACVSTQVLPAGADCKTTLLTVGGGDWTHANIVSFLRSILLFVIDNGDVVGSTNPLFVESCINAMAPSTHVSKLGDAAAAASHSSPVRSVLDILAVLQLAYNSDTNNNATLSSTTGVTTTADLLAENMLVVIRVLPVVLAQQQLKNRSVLDLLESAGDLQYSDEREVVLPTSYELLESLLMAAASSNFNGHIIPIQGFGGLFVGVVAGQFRAYTSTLAARDPQEGAFLSSARSNSRTLSYDQLGGSSPTRVYSVLAMDLVIINHGKKNAPGSYYYPSKCVYKHSDSGAKFYCLLLGFKGIRDRKLTMFGLSSPGGSLMSVDREHSSWVAMPAELFAGGGLEGMTASFSAQLKQNSLLFDPTHSPRVFDSGSLVDVTPGLDSFRSQQTHAIGPASSDGGAPTRTLCQQYARAEGIIMRIKIINYAAVIVFKIIYSFYSIIRSSRSLCGTQPRCAPSAGSN